jgi:hypothetical protein
MWQMTYGFMAAHHSAEVDAARVQSCAGDA